MDNRREEQRQSLFKSIWDIANKLRGSVDGWDFKSYILGFMFYRFISENLTEYLNKQEKVYNPFFDYSLLDDESALTNKESIVEEKGFFIKPSDLFKNVRKNARNNSNLNITLNNVFKNIENSAIGSDSENDFKGLFSDVDVNSNKLGSTLEKRNSKLADILDDIGDMDLGDFSNHTIDAFGDAYEYLMFMYASNAGKSGGEFFTPQEVSELLARLAIGDKKKISNVYDPACGSGSLLLQAIKILGRENIADGLYGQEINLTTYNLCRINMFLHNIEFNKFQIACDDTLMSPYFEDKKPFEVIVSNPPYSISWKGDDDPTLINDYRFRDAGVLAPKSKADMAFILHSLSWLRSDGKAAIVCFPGILYRGGAEQKIRSYLINNNFIDAVIQLPDNLFYSTQIGTCIIVLSKSKKDSDVVFIDGSKQFIKATNNNKLTHENIMNIYNAYNGRKDKEYFVKVVKYEKIKENNYNLSVSSYVAKEDTSEKIDINLLNSEIEDIVNKEKELRDSIDKIIKELED